MAGGAPELGGAAEGRTPMKLIRVALAVAAGSLLAACSPTPSTALVAGDTRYTISDVNAMSAACSDELGTEVPARGVVQYLAIGAVFDTAAAASGTTPTESDLDEMMSQALGSPVTDADCITLTRAVAKTQLLSTATDDLIQQSAKDTAIDLNPMFGKWDVTGSTILSDSASLSVLAADDQQ